MDANIIRRLVSTNQQILFDFPGCTTLAGLILVYRTDWNATSSWTSITDKLQILALAIAYNMVSFSSLSRIHKSTLHPRSNLADRLSQQDMSRPTRKSMAVAEALVALAKKALHAQPNYHTWNFNFYFLSLWNLMNPMPFRRIHKTLTLVQATKSLNWSQKSSHTNSSLLVSNLQVLC